MKKEQKYKPTEQQRKSLYRKTSFGIRFTRSKPIDSAVGKDGNWVKARSPGKVKFVSARRFGSVKEAITHGKRFKRIEGHAAYEVVVLKLSPNAWVNFKTGKTNPLIGAKRTNRR